MRKKRVRGKGIPGSYPPSFPSSNRNVGSNDTPITVSIYRPGIIDNTSPVSALIMGRLCLSWHIDVRLDAGDLVSVMFCR
ncbi:hypothetical protein CEXT_577551 [Caerostris extrusa]|uniref:Uncharacterized protein n=1 Tax=Caerostris extrusa TaxID=172846 RepID=A0AAV4R9W7_CAEEX|nr:hypothetical protein CEXT_577551 [Caerostris extrusa]